MKQRYEFRQGQSAKFWAVEVRGTDVVTNWGRIGTAGQTKTASYGSRAAAKAAATKAAAGKANKGYVLDAAKRRAKKTSGKKTSKAEQSARRKTGSDRTADRNVVDILDASNKKHIGRQTEDGLTLLWRVSHRHGSVLRVDRDFVAYARLDDLKIIDLETGKDRGKLAKKYLRATVRDGELWVHTARGYDVYALPELAKSGAVDLPAARTPEHGSLIDSGSRAFHNKTAYRTVEPRKLRFSSKAKNFVQATNLRTKSQTLLARLPVAGYVDGLEVGADAIWVVVWPSQSLRYLVVLDRKTGAVLHQEKITGDSTFVRWKSDVLMENKGTWRRWDAKKGKPVPCKGIPKHARLTVADNRLFAQTKTGLLRLAPAGQDFKTDAKQTAVKNSKAVFRHKKRLGCLAPKNGVGGAHTLMWLDRTTLSMLGSASVKLACPFETEAIVAGGYLVVSGDGATAFRLG